MKNFYLNVIIILLTGFSSHAQWTQRLFNNANVTVLKKVNNVCFAYGIDNSSLQGKLYRSDNNGNTWVAVDSVTFKFILIKDITYDSAHSNYVACTFAQNGIFISSDGNTWASTGTDWDGDGIAYINSELVLTTSNADAGVGISTNGGSLFFSSNNGLVYPYYAHYVTRINNTLYISMQGSSPCEVSTNSGASWAAQSNGLSNFTNCFFKFKNKLYCGTYLAGVKRYNTNTSTWINSKNGLPHTSNIWALASKGDSLFCGGDTIGVWMNTNSVWSNFSSGLPVKTTVHKLLTTGKYLFAATNNGLWEIKLSLSPFDEPEITDFVSEKISANSIKIFPTITSGRLTIQSSAIPVSIMLMNENGSIIKQWSNTSEIDISDVHPGNYFITININGKLFTQHVIKSS
jgi:hypothetical protein